MCKLEWGKNCDCLTNVLRDHEHISMHSYKRCKWNFENKAIFTENLNHASGITALNEISNKCTLDEDVNDVVEMFNDTLCGIANHMMYKRYGSCNRNMSSRFSQPELWDSDCETS